MINIYTYTRLVAKLTNSHIMHIIIAILKLHVSLSTIVLNSRDR